jgi:tetratricopeptide (TPR) repeat protein
MKEYLEALVYYKKAFEISHKTPPANHPYFAPLCGHIGMVYVHVDDHATARVYYEQAIKLSEHSLPSNHPHLKLYKDSLEYIKKNL